jgi:hypothetical protein
VTLVTSRKTQHLILVTRLVTLVTVDAPLRGEMLAGVAFAESEEQEALTNT